MDEACERIKEWFEGLKKPDMKGQITFIETGNGKCIIKDYDGYTIELVKAKDA